MEPVAVGHEQEHLVGDERAESQRDGSDGRAVRPDVDREHLAEEHDRHEPHAGAEHDRERPVAEVREPRELAGGKVTTVAPGTVKEHGEHQGDDGHARLGEQ